ncbi:hypothetical protein [uncultured Clostridium sp.]|jgi:hypothetical protein|uniref:hypothetical protein n=1 Tax=uncultured Clostridium sp. TaxID=59620 RepID=UPI002673B521|nr:hypothetical protein [uncultured Clostridium sp.]
MKNKGEKKFGKIAISLIISIILFVGLLVLESNITSPNGKVEVVKAVNNIKEGTVIDENNKDSLFEVVTVDGSLDFETVLRNTDELVGRIIDTEIKKGEIISSKRLIDKDSVLGKIENPVETSVRVTDISQVVGGILREGDIIDISVVNSTTTENEKVLEGVYVSKAFSSDGTEVDRNSGMSVLTVNIIVSPEDEAKLNQAIELGTIRVSKMK